MECVEAQAALKSSFIKTTTVKLTPQTLLQELSTFNVQNVTPVEDFFVDDFLNFSEEEEDEKDENFIDKKQQPQQQNQNESHQIFHPIINDHFASLPTTELTVPVQSLPLTLKKKNDCFKFVFC